MAWGYHLSLDCYAGDKDLVTNGTNIAAFAKALVERIDMKAYGEPQVIHFGEDEKQGYTLVQLIETSNICAHFCDDTGDFYLDVFSCKPYDIVKVHDVVRQFFSPKRIVEHYIERE
jgi:S-adenosylmethionine decarboxylase